MAHGAWILPYVWTHNISLIFLRIQLFVSFTIILSFSVQSSLKWADFFGKIILLYFSFFLRKIPQLKHPALNSSDLCFSSKYFLDYGIIATKGSVWSCIPKSDFFFYTWNVDNWFLPLQDPCYFLLLSEN